MRLSLDNLFKSKPLSSIITTYNRISIFSNSVTSFDVIQTKLNLLEFSDHNLFIRSNYFYKRSGKENLYVVGGLISPIELYGNDFVDNGIKIINNINALEFNDDRLIDIKYYGDKYGFFDKCFFSPTKNCIEFDDSEKKEELVVGFDNVIDSETYIYSCSFSDTEIIRDSVLRNIIKKFILDTYLFGIQKMTLLFNSKGDWNIESFEMPTNCGSSYRNISFRKFSESLHVFKNIITDYIRSISSFSTFYICIDESHVFVKIFDPINGLNKTEKYTRGYVDYYVFEGSRSNVRIEDFHNSTILLLE